MQANWQAIDDYFGERVCGWFRSSRGSDGKKVPSMSERIRSARNQEELVLWLNTIEDNRLARLELNERC